MTQQGFEFEGSLSFLSGLALTIRQIEKSQPEIGFRKGFMDRLETNLKGAILPDAKDKGEGAKQIFNTLTDLLIAMDTLDEREGNDKHSHPGETDR